MKAGRAKEGWGRGHGARNNNSGSHPVEEARRRFITANSTLAIVAALEEPAGELGQAGSALTLAGAEPLCVLKPYSSAAKPQHTSQLLLLQ